MLSLLRWIVNRPTQPRIELLKERQELEFRKERQHCIEQRVESLSSIPKVYSRAIDNRHRVRKNA